MDIHGYAPAVIADTDTIIRINYYLYLSAVSGQGLIHGIIHHLIYQMVQAAGVGISDIHGRPLTHSLNALQHLDGSGIITMIFFFFLFLTHYFSLSQQGRVEAVRKR